MDDVCGLIPLVGGIWLLVMMATESQEGTNEYGDNPKSIEDGNLLDN